MAVEVPITVRNFNEIGGFQFSMQWDPAVLQFTGVSGFNHSVATDELFFFGETNFNLDQINNGNLTVLYEQILAVDVSLPDNASIFTLEFEVVSTGSPTLIAFTDTPTLRQVASFTSSSSVLGSEDGTLSFGEPIPSPVPPTIDGAYEYAYTFVDVEPNLEEESRWKRVVTGNQPWEPDSLNQEEQRLNAEQAAGISQAYGRAFINPDSEQGRFSFNQDFDVAWTDTYTKQRSAETTEGTMTVEDTLSIEYVIEQRRQPETPWWTP